MSQHGCDTHASDPLAHLNVTTTAMGAAARLVDVIAHRWTGGRWLATGGGGYGVYRVVPRAWAHVWLAGAHREAPDRLPAEWRARWADEAARYGDSSLPETLDDPPNAGLPFDAEQRDAEARSLAIAELARIVSVPRLIREAVDARLVVADRAADRAAAGRRWGRVQRLDRRPAGDPRHRRSSRPSIGSRSRRASSRTSIRELLRDLLPSPALSLTMAVDGATAVGLVVSALDDPGAPAAPRSVLAIGVAPAWRRQGLATRMLAAHVDAFDRAGTPWEATVTLAERDPVEPLDRSLRERDRGPHLRAARALSRTNPISGCGWWTLVRAALSGAERAPPQRK